MEQGQHWSHVAHGTAEEVRNFFLWLSEKFRLFFI
jgi:hypothetical protein